MIVTCDSFGFPVPVEMLLTHKHSPDAIGMFKTKLVPKVKPDGTLIVCKSVKVVRVKLLLYKIKSVDGSELLFLQIIPTILIVLNGEI